MPALTLQALPSSLTTTQVSPTVQTTPSPPAAAVVVPPSSQVTPTPAAPANVVASAGGALAPVAAEGKGRTKKKQRAPILDPWADELPTDEPPTPRQAHHTLADLGPANEDDVITGRTSRKPRCDESLPPPVLRQRAVSRATTRPPTATALARTAKRRDRRRPRSCDARRSQASPFRGVPG